VYAQDLIALRDGNVIEAKVTEISPSEISYKHFDNLDGPTIIISKTDVLSIRYENRSVEIINPAPALGYDSGKRTKSARPETALDPNKLNVAINANPAGLLTYGPSVCIELGKGKFNSEINLIFPFGLAGSSGKGFGGLATFNYFLHRWNGGFYLGGGAGYVFQKDYYHYTLLTGPLNNLSPKEFHSNSHLLTAGLNLGYKFILSSGLYFRTGAFLGAGLDFGFPREGADGSFVSFYGKPDLTIGYAF
jgi:hypothetical protein